MDKDRITTVCPHCDVILDVTAYAKLTLGEKWQIA